MSPKTEGSRQPRQAALLCFTVKADNTLVGLIYIARQIDVTKDEDPTCLCNKQV